MAEDKKGLLQDEDLRKYLNKLLNRVSGLQAIAISDRDGVPLLKESSQSYKEVSNEAQLTATFALASEQSSKLRMGKNRTITAFLDNRVVLHINHLPVIVTLIGESNMNLGVVHSFVPDIKKVLDPLRNSIVEAEKENLS